MIYEPLKLLEQIQLFSTSKAGEKLRNLTPLSILQSFQNNALTRYDQIQPKDPSSIELKSLYLSEYECWSTLISLHNSSRSYTSFAEKEKPEKFSYFKIFNAEFQRIFITKDKSSLKGLYDENCYLNTRYITDMMLVNDILNYDMTLYTIHQLIGDLNYRNDKVPIINEEPRLLNYEAVSEMAQWDFMGSLNPEINEKRMKNDVELLEEVYQNLRIGNLIEAQNFLKSKNRYILAAVLNSGLAYHDFTQIDREMGDIQQIRGMLVEEDSILGNLNWDRKDVRIGERKLKALDFMLCEDYEDAYRDRKNFYLEKEMTQSKDFFQGSCGNKNWLYSISNFYSLSIDSPSKYERAIYGYMSSNPFSLLPMTLSFQDRLWVFLRSYLNQEIIRRFISLTYLYKDNLLNFCMFDEDFLNFERQDPFMLYDQMIHSSEEIIASIGSLDFLMRFIEKDQNINQFYYKIQFLLLKSRILSIFRGDHIYYEEFYQTLLEFSNLNNENFPCVQFLCGLALSMRLLGYFDASNLELIDKIVLKSIGDFKINKQFQQPPEEMLKLFSYLNDETLKISSISEYLLELTPDKNNFKSIKTKLIELMPSLAQKILDNLYLKSQELTFFIDEESIDLKRIQSLKWLFADRVHIDIAISRGLKLIRNFIFEGKNEWANRVLKDYLSQAFSPQKELGEWYYEEYEMYEKFFKGEEIFLNVGKGKGNKGEDNKLDYLIQIAKEQIKLFLFRNTNLKEKYSVINLANKDFLRILNQDPERKLEIFEVKSNLIEKSLVFLIKLYELREITYEDIEFLDFLTDEDYALSKFLKEEQYREFLYKFTIALQKSRFFVKPWVERSNVLNFDEKYFE